MKKGISVVLFFQAVCFALMIAGDIASNKGLMSSGFILDLVGAVLCPMLLAVVAGIAGIRDNISVLKAFPAAASTVGGIGLARGLLYFSASGLAGFGGAMKLLLISFILLTVWTLIFEITRFLMNKETKYNKKKKRP